jgi:DNA replication initiation complex subunit (GINS family)
MQAKEINITYETLYEVLKREKDMTDLQKLDANFFADFVSYLNEKKKLLTKEDSLFSYEEKKKVEKQIDNARRIIKDIYERREKKAIGIALIKSRTKSNVVDTSSFLAHEKMLFNEIAKTLDDYRSKIIKNIMDGALPETGARHHPKAEKQMEPETKLVRFLSAVPKFVGKELEEYGPFEEEDIANLPSEIADLLIGKERAEEIKSS